MQIFDVRPQVLLTLLQFHKLFNYGSANFQLEISEHLIRPFGDVSFSLRATESGL